MNRREFYKTGGALGLGLIAGKAAFAGNAEPASEPGFYKEGAKKLPAREFDVVVAGGGTAGVICAIAAARNGARTVLVENKGYVGGVAVEGGTALHSFYNLWKAFPGVEKRQLVRGIPAEMVDKLTARGGATGYAVMDGKRVKGGILESRSGREVIFAKSFVDCTGYADLAAHAGAAYTEPNDYAVVNSMGLGNVDIEKYNNYLVEKKAVGQYFLPRTLCERHRKPVCFGDDDYLRPQRPHVNTKYGELHGAGAGKRHGCCFVCTQ